MMTWAKQWLWWEWWFCCCQVKTTERLIYPSGTFPPSLASEPSGVENQSKKNLTTGKVCFSCLLYDICPYFSISIRVGGRFQRGRASSRGTVMGPWTLGVLRCWSCSCNSKRCLTCCENLKTNINQKGCLKWKGSQKQDVHHKVFKGINHVDMLRRGMW